MDREGDVLISIEPLDTLFFRDGRPYDQRGSDQTTVVSRFPPSPQTLVGAVRAACARALGWNGQDGWTDDIKQHLGDGATLAELRFRGPLLMHGDELFFPAPANLLCSEDASHLGLLQPGPAIACDLGGAVHLPALAQAQADEDDALKSATNAWITSAGLQQSLQADVPPSAELRIADALWRTEARVGIARDTVTGTTGEGALYSPHHVRLSRGVSLALWAAGLPDVLERVRASPQPVGGESRAAWMEPVDTSPPLPESPNDFVQENGKLHYSAIVLTPLPLDQAPRPGAGLPGLPGTLVSACLPRAVTWGGWDSVQRKPLPLTPHLAPGSVLFMQATPSDEAALRVAHMTTIGPKANWGFGLIAIGTWSYNG